MLSLITAHNAAVAAAGNTPPRPAVAAGDGWLIFLVENGGVACSFNVRAAGRNRTGMPPLERLGELISSGNNPDSPSWQRLPPAAKQVAGGVKPLSSIQLGRGRMARSRGPLGLGGCWATGVSADRPACGRLIQAVGRRPPETAASRRQRIDDAIPACADGLPMAIPLRRGCGSAPNTPTRRFNQCAVGESHLYPRGGGAGGGRCSSRGPRLPESGDADGLAYRPRGGGSVASRHAALASA